MKKWAVLFLLVIAAWIPERPASAVSTLIGVTLTVKVDDIGDFYNNGVPIYNYPIGTWKAEIQVNIDPAAFSPCGNLLAIKNTNVNTAIGTMFVFRFLYSNPADNWCYSSEDAYNAGNIRMYNQRTDLGNPSPPPNWFDPSFNDSTWNDTVYLLSQGQPYAINSPCNAVVQNGINPYPTINGACACEQVHYRIPFPTVPNGNSVCTALSLTKTASATSLTCGQTVTFTMSVSNVGSQGATGAVLTDKVPSYISVQSINNGGTLSGNTITWNLANPFAAGASTTVSWVGVVQNYVGTITATQADITGTNFGNRASSGPNLTIACTNPTATPTYTPVPCATEVLNGGSLLANGVTWEGTGFNTWTITGDTTTVNSSGPTANNFNGAVWSMPDPASPLAGTVYDVSLEVVWKGTNGKSSTTYLDVDFNTSDGTSLGMIPASGATTSAANQKGFAIAATDVFQTNTIDLNSYKTSWTYLELKNLAFMFHATGAVTLDRISVKISYVNCPSSSSPTPTPTRTRTPSVTYTPLASWTATVSPTSTPSASPSPTATPTPTFSHSPTVTPTRTPSSTFTVTQTATPTLTSTGTPSSTPTYTPSATFTPSPTPSNTPTATPTSTPSKTFTPSNTATVTPTATPTATETDTFSPSPTQSDTPTRTVTRTVTPTFTDSDTPSGTPTATPTATQTVTFSPSATPSETPTFTPTATQTVTFSPSPTPSSSPTETATATETVTFTGSPTVTFTATETVTYSVTFSYTESRTFTDTLTATPPPSATATRTPTRSFTRTRTRTNSPTVTPTFTISNTFTVTPTLSDKTVVFEIKAVYPNPFQDRGTIYFTLANEAEVELVIYNVAGEPLWRFDMQGKPGNNTIEWDGRNEMGGRVASGIYVLRLKATGSQGSGGVTRWANVCVAR